ncbi:MAG: transglutaminase family protein [Alphaproteobacteria bacterium]|nr:transglutaminase family protein [Alphaproteobacteria bacterium]
MIESQASNILSQLSEVGEQLDADIDLFQTALLIAALDHPGRLTERYTLHIDRMIEACEQAFDGLNDTAKNQLNVLRDVLFSQEEYDGDSENFDRLDNADIMSVIDRRCGLPVTLSILYMAVAKALGWHVQALSFPAHVFLRIECGGERIVFDPFDGARVMEAHDLREKLKDLVGGHAELSSDYYEAMTNRDVIVRLQNNIKTRLISEEDFDAALERVDIMRLILPNDPRLLFEAGILNARAGRRMEAITLLRKYVDVVDSQADREDALMLLRELEGDV